MKQMLTILSLPCWLACAVCETYNYCNGIPFTLDPFQILIRDWSLVILLLVVLYSKD